MGLGFTGGGKEGPGGLGNVGGADGAGVNRTRVGMDIAGEEEGGEEG